MLLLTYNSFCLQDIVTGNIGEYSTTVGDENYFLPYNVRVTPFNIKGEGVPGYNDTVYSAEGSKSIQRIGPFHDLF